MTVLGIADRATFAGKPVDCVWSRPLGRDMFHFTAAFGQNDLAAMRNSTYPRLKCQGPDVFTGVESQFATPAGGFPNE